jgi:hypothetical protein
VWNHPSEPTLVELTPIRKVSDRDWSVDPALRVRIGRRLAEFLDPESESGEGLKDRQRTVFAVARTIALFSRLAIERQKLEMKGPRPVEADCRGALLWKAEEIALSLKQTKFN